MHVFVFDASFACRNRDTANCVFLHPHSSTWPTRLRPHDGTSRTRDPRTRRHTVAEQAAKADELVDEAKAAGGGDHPVTVHAKMLRVELLKVKADFERELETWPDAAKSKETECGHEEPASHHPSE